LNVLGIGANGVPVIIEHDGWYFSVDVIHGKVLYVPQWISLASNGRAFYFGEIPNEIKNKAVMLAKKFMKEKSEYMEKRRKNYEGISFDDIYSMQEEYMKEHPISKMFDEEVEEEDDM